MATYKKPLKAFVGGTLMGYTARALDTEDGKRLGSYAIDAFEAHKTITAEVGDKKVFVPFHAVKTAVYGTETADAEKADAYCGGAGGDTYTIIWTPYDRGNDCESTEPITQDDVRIGGALDFPCHCTAERGPGWYLKHDYDAPEDMFVIEDENTLTEQIASYAINGVIEIHQNCER